MEMCYGRAEAKTECCSVGSGRAKIGWRNSRGKKKKKRKCELRERRDELSLIFLSKHGTDHVRLLLLSPKELSIFIVGRMVPSRLLRCLVVVVRVPFFCSLELDPILRKLCNK